MAYIHTGVNVWNLDKAANKLGLSIDEIIELACNNKITLSIDVPPRMNVWLMTVNLNKDYMTLHRDVNFTGIHLLPIKRDAVLLNLSQDDCTAFQSSNPKLCFFKSIYQYSNFHSSSGIPSIEFVGDDSKNWPDTLLKDDTLTIEVLEGKLEDKDYLNSIEKGLFAISGSNDKGYGRRFTLFKDDFCMPESGTTLVDVEVQDIQESDLRIADQELSRILQSRQLSKSKVNQPYFGMELGDWCSNSFKLLLDLACRISEQNLDSKAMEKFRIEQVDSELEKLKNIGKITSEQSPEFMDYFFKLAASDQCFYKKDFISELKNKELKLTLEPKIPTVLKHLINYANEKTKVQRADTLNVYLNQLSITDDLKGLGFNAKLAKYAASIISRSPRSERVR